MKKYHRDEEANRVNRVTSVFEADTVQDDILNRYSKAEIVERSLIDSQTREIDSILSEYKDVITNEPGLTHLSEFAIDTGEVVPIF